MTIDVCGGLFAPAKVNLCLHVTGQRPDGYHLLDSLVAFADVGDQVSLHAGPELSLTVEGPFSDGVPTGPGNLVWKAAVAAGWTGQITLQKNLPHGGGIGGGSSDAAAVLRHLDRPELALSLGADVPVCIGAVAQRMQGIGEQISPVSLPPLPAVLVTPPISVATQAVFGQLHSKSNPPMPGQIPSNMTAARLIQWLSGMRNDLEHAAIASAPAIAEVLSQLHDIPGAALVRMSGSGATCFAVFEDPAMSERAANSLKAAHPTWWVQATTLR